jgi:hypothetical protein
MADDLRRRLREGGREELAGLLREHAAGLSPEEALLTLANPHLDGEGVERLAAVPGLLAAYAVRRAVALHPQAPEVLARRLLVGLYWRDLMAAGQDVRLRPTLRRAADTLLGERLAGLAIGERMVLARGASPGLLASFRHEANPRVVQALLENGRLTEGSLLSIVRNERAPPALLEVVARDRRWGVRYPVRLTLARNPATPVTAALSLLPHLKKADLVALAQDLRIASAVRRRARLLSGQEARGGGI